MLRLARTAKLDALAAGAALVAVLLACGSSRPAHSADAATRIADAAPVVRPPREGTRLESALGTFERHGGRIAFVAAGGDTFLALENLNLQRVADKLDLGDGVFQWTVSGTITEFRGQRFLLVSRAQARRLTAAEARAAGLIRGVR